MGKPKRRTAGKGNVAAEDQATKGPKKPRAEGRDDVDAAAAQGGADSTDGIGVQGGRDGSSSRSGQAMAMRSTQYDSDCYNMNHERRGKAIIFNNKTFHASTGMGERMGTDVDAKNLKQIFQEMGFDVHIEDDKTILEMKATLERVAREDHSNADCFVCTILSHGEDGYVYGKDKPIEIEELVAPFKGHRCKTLAGKPKLFFIQACRGSKLDDGVDFTDSGEDMETDAVDVRRIPTEADFLMAYSVVQGYYSWRNSNVGSWFIQALVQVLRENWHRMELLAMMTRVCKKVAYDFESNTPREYMRFKKQSPCITSMLTKEVYFMPKK